MRYVLDSTGSGSCLQLAVRKSHVEAAKVCLQYGASTYGTAHDTSPPLHTACIHGNLELVKLLVWSGSSIHAEDIEGMSPILRASLSGHVDVINYLIDQGANLEAGPDEPTPLVCAVKRGHAEIIKLLLRRGSSLHVRDSSHRTCLHVAVYSDNEETLDILLENGGHLLVNSRDSLDSTPLHFAAINRNLKMILKLLHFGADVNVMDEEEKLPLHYAAEDDDRLTPLLAMGPVGSAEAIKLLLDNGANIDDLSKNRCSALNVASFHGNTSAIKILLDREARIDNDSPFGFGVLGAAITGGKEQVCMEIVKHKRWKEILKIKGSDGFTCMKGLIDKFPDVAKVVMDKCIVPSNHATTDENYSVTYNFEFLNVHPDERTNEKGYIYFGPQSMIETDKRELLFHPLTRELLRHRWNSPAKYQAMLALFMYVLFVVNMTLFMLCLGQLDLETGKKLKDNEYRFCNKKTMEQHSIVVSVFSGVWAIVHVFRIFKERWNYFDINTAIEVITLVSCVMASSVGAGFGDLESRFTWGIISLLLCYLALLFYIQTIFNSGIYVTMLFGVLKSFVKVIVTFLILLLVFALLFHLLLYSALQPKKVIRGQGIYANKTVHIKHPFQDFGMSAVKVIAMMIGELEYTRFLVEQQNAIPTLSIVVFGCFAVFLPIVLMNLLIGLAVGDIDAVQKNAELKLISIKIETIYAMEQQLPTTVLRYFYKPFIVKYPNKEAKGFFQRLKVVGDKLVNNSNDYEDILEDQEREDIENMEGLMNRLSNRMDEQDHRLNQLLKDVQQQRTTLNKLASAMLKENDSYL